MQTSYPVFENGQVLSASHLNDLAEYLEEQDRLSRNKLIGIGIVCGLDVSFDDEDDVVHVSRGCAVTSEGYLIVLEGTSYNRFRPYTLPVPEAEEAPDELFDGAPYPFLHDDDGKQIELWELLSTGFEPGPGEDEPEEIDEEFASGKVALLFLEHNLESLKNCDISDCGDRGAEIEFTPRVLLVGKDDAQSILDHEEQKAQRPVHRGMHPRYDLEELRLEKLLLAANEVDTFEELVRRIFEIGSDLAPRLTDALSKSYEAFKYMLKDGYPVESFPDGPFGDPNYFERLMDHMTKNIVLCQYFYGFMGDVVNSYNEFLRAAIRLDSECCPNPDRFPLHVLLGEVKERPTAFGGDPLGSGFEPSDANTGFGATTRPEPFRHHFIPSPLFGRHHGGLRKVQSLHYRTFLLAYRFTTDDLLERGIRLTPSRDGNVTLSEQAIPYYYALAQAPAADDLARNWSYSTTARNRLDQVFSHQYLDMSDHPLTYRMDGHDFYRVEGTIGKGLGQAMGEIIRQKRALGLSFAVEPVYMGFSVSGDEESKRLNDEAREAAQDALRKLVTCRMRELDVVFLVLMGAIFRYLIAIITLLSRKNSSAVAGLAQTGEARPVFTRRSAREVQLRSEMVELTLKSLRGKTYEKGFITKRAATGDDPKTSLGQLYEQVRDAPSTANLFDRTLEFTREAEFDNPEKAAQRLYPSVSLLDKAEELAASTTAKSIADLDIQAFEARYDGFVRAFDAYLEQQPGEEANELKAVREELAASYGSVAATAPQSVLGGMVEQLHDRVRNLFGELLLGAYAKRHPGAEHKGGVPEGGTLVLLYTHRSLAARVLKEHRSSFETRANELANLYTRARETVGMLTDSPLPRREIADPELLLARRGREDDPLDAFVVLGDLCLPYLCCDADCSDIEVADERDERPTPQPGIVRGAVLLGAREREALNVSVLERASVSVTNEATREPVDVDFTSGQFTFKAPPGTYRIAVKGPRGVGTTERLITVREGADVTEDVVLRRRE